MFKTYDLVGIKQIQNCIPQKMLLTKKVLKLLSAIRENGYTPNDVVWEAFFTVSANSQHYDSLLQLMKKKGTTVIYSFID